MLRKLLIVIVLITSILFLDGCRKRSSGAEAKKQEVGLAELQAISVKLTVPDLGWIINIEEAYKIEGELWVISALHRSPGMFGQQITTKSDTVKVPYSSLSVKHFVLGKTWGWQNEEPYVFLNSRDEIAEELESGKLVFKNGVDR